MTDLFEWSQQVRDAYAAGWGHIMIEGRKFLIEEFERSANFTSGGEHVRRQERWLRVKPEDGALTPMMVIEPVDGQNLRTSTGAKP